MNNLTLRQLRYFEALARQNHFGRAAEICSVSQPALSVQIKELEDNLGAVLFERGPRHVHLTAFGEDFAVRVRDILQSVDELGELARAAQAGLSGRLRIGVIPTIAPYLLPTLIGNLTQMSSKPDIHIRETVTPRLIDELNDGQLDTAIVALPISEPSLNELALFTEDMLLVRPADQANEPVPAREKLSDMRLLMLEEGHCFRDQVLTFCNMPQTRAGARLDGSSISTLVQMVGAGIGVTLIPEMAVAVETRFAKVSLGRFADPQPSRTVGMIWRKTSPLTKQLEQVAQEVRAAAETVRHNHLA